MNYKYHIYLYLYVDVYLCARSFCILFTLTGNKIAWTKAKTATRNAFCVGAERTMYDLKVNRKQWNSNWIK